MPYQTTQVRLPTATFQTERLLRDEIVRVGKLLYDRNLIVATDGNISARLDANRVVCTPSGLCKGLMTADQLIVVDLDGNRVGLPNAANRHLKPTSEMRMHLEAYRRRPDVMGIVHAHPPTVIAASIAGLDMAQCLIPEVIVIIGRHSHNAVCHAIQRRKRPCHPRINRRPRRNHFATAWHTRGWQ